MFLHACIGLHLSSDILIPPTATLRLIQGECSRLRACQKISPLLHH